jgi:hypothetical protein
MQHPEGDLDKRVLAIMGGFDDHRTPPFFDRSEGATEAVSAKGATGCKDLAILPCVV